LSSPSSRRRKKLIVAGVSTEVCVAFVALSAIKAGYEMYAVIDASGTWNKLVQELAFQRMVEAGVVRLPGWLSGRNCRVTGAALARPRL
jgi:nicotinamidase-related amidase